MRSRAGNHGFSTTARAFTLAVAVVAWLAQFASLSHEMTVRHFRCAEHGELTHIAATVADVPLPSGALRRSWKAGDTGAADTHEHCAVTFTVAGQPSTFTPGLTGDLPAVPPAAAPPAPRLERGRTVALAAAPKTSPPRA